jgi:hypothetical protein
MKGMFRSLAAIMLITLATALTGCGSSHTIQTQPIATTDTPTIADGRTQQPTAKATGSLSFRLAVTNPAVDGPKKTAKAAMATVASGGGGGGSVAIDYPLEYRKRVDQINVTLWEEATGNWKYSFPFKVVNGEVVAKMEGLIPGTYRITIDAGANSMNVTFFHGETTGEVKAGEDSHVKAVLETLTAMRTVFAISSMPGNFDSATPIAYQSVSKTANNEPYYSDGTAWIDGEKIVVPAEVQLSPEPGVKVELSVTDKDGKVFIQTIEFNILTLIDNIIANGYQDVAYTPSTSLTIDIVWPDQIKQSDLFQPATNIATGAWPQAVVIADIFGKNDIVMVTSSYGDSDNNHKLLIYSSTGNTSYELDGEARSLAVGDLNGDGKNDIAVALPGKGIKLFYNNGNGSKFDAYLLETPETLKVRLADLDNNGQLDIVCIGWGTNKADIFMQNPQGSNGQGFSGSGPFSKTTIAVNHDGYDDLAIGDLNGDGLKDIVVMSGQGMAGGVNIMLQTATGFAAPIHQQINSSQGVAIGDIDRDGSNEIVVSSGGNVPDSMINVIKVYSDGGIWAYTMPSSHIPAAIRVADVNGDNRNDVIVLHDGWGSVGVYLQKQDGTLKEEQLYGAYAYQYNPDAMAIGDANNDGKIDIVTLDNNYGIGLLYGK